MQNGHTGTNCGTNFSVVFLKPGPFVCVTNRMKTVQTVVLLAFLAISPLAAVTAFGQENPETLFKTADGFRTKADPENAMIYFEKAAVEFHKAGNTERAIDAYTQIGAILNRQDRFEKAKAVLEKALAIGRSAKDPESPAIATTYVNLGVTYGAEGKFQEALGFHNKALAIRLEKVGKTSPEVATSYGNIGNVYLRMKDYDRAIDAHQKARQIREKVFGKNSVEIVESYRGLGNAYKEKRNYKESLDYYQMALANKITQLGPNHKDLVRFYKGISEVYSLMGDKARSDEYRIKGEEIEK